MGEHVEPKVRQVLVVFLAEQVTHAKFWDAFQVFSQAITTQDNREMVNLMNQNAGTITKMKETLLG